MAGVNVNFTFSFSGNFTRRIFNRNLISETLRFPYLIASLELEIFFFFAKSLK